MGVATQVMYEPRPPLEELVKIYSDSGGNAIPSSALTHVINSMSSDARQRLCEGIRSHYQDPSVSMPIITKAFVSIGKGSSHSQDPSVLIPIITKSFKVENDDSTDCAPHNVCTHSSVKQAGDKNRDNEYTAGIVLLSFIFIVAKANTHTNTILHLFRTVHNMSRTSDD